MKCLIINNPVSGHSKSPAEIEEIVNRLKTKYETVDLKETLENVTSENIACENIGKYDVFVVLGGDGTFNEMLRGIVGKPDRPVVGYIPSGTVNDFARSNKIPLTYKEAVEVILNGKTKLKSTMFINGIPACYLIGAGMFTSSSYTAKNEVKRKIGKLAYYLEILFHDKGRHGEQLEITLDGEKHNSLYTFVAGLNNAHIGGLLVTKQYNDNKDFFYVLLSKRKKGFFPLIVSLLAMVRTYLKKIENIKDTKHIVIRKVNSMSVKSLTNTPWNIDGERGPVGDAEITYQQNTFEIFVP
ncbi:MAG: hypothetical protein LBT30_05505 [Clostridiales bacterium]|jgi:YegS/Rv2252/BmrU family lipid kinase|nr:hypothetical protein [Clostridiales bacterium]